MIRKSALWVAALALFVLIPSAHAAQGDWKISLLGGIAVPAGDFSKKTGEDGLGAKLGFVGGPSIDYMVTDQIAIGADMQYQRNDLDSDETNPDDLKYTQIGGAAHLKYWIPMEESPMNVYLVGGAGFTNFKWDRNTGSDSENRFSAFGGLGVGANVSDQISLGIQSDFMYVDLKEFGISSFGVRGGLTFTLPGGGGY